MILGREPKNQVIWTTRCKVVAKYISIYFDIFQQKLDDIGGHQGTSKTKKIVNEMHWTTPGLHCEWL